MQAATAPSSVVVDLMTWKYRWKFAFNHAKQKLQRWGLWSSLWVYESWNQTHIQQLSSWQLRKHLLYSVYFLLQFVVVIVCVSLWCFGQSLCGFPTQESGRFKTRPQDQGRTCFTPTSFSWLMIFWCLVQTGARYRPNQKKGRPQRQLLGVGALAMLWQVPSELPIRPGQMLKHMRFLFAFPVSQVRWDE